MIRVHTWSEKTRRYLAGGVELLDSDDDPPDTLWIDLDNPTPEEEERIFQRYFPVHPLSLEDITRPRREPDEPPHFPKVEEFPNYLFVIVNPLGAQALQAIQGVDSNNDQFHLNGQLSAVLTHRMLITHHYLPFAPIVQLRTYLHKHESMVERGPDYLFHLILDVMVDQYAPLLDQVDDSLDDLEIEVFTSPSTQLLARLLALKHGIIALRKTMIYEREVLARLARGEFSLIAQNEMAYYRNVYDHLIRFTELIEASREMVMDLMQTLLASQANKLNEIMKVLTMISTTILPMTLIAGIYGMNFEQNVWPDYRLSPHGFALILGLMFASGATAFGFFRWMKWI